MKEWKLVNSKEAQEKAFKLGYEWNDYKKTYSHGSANFLYLCDDGRIEEGSRAKVFVSDDGEEITTKDFLKLQE